LIFLGEGMNNTGSKYTQNPPTRETGPGEKAGLSP